MHLPGCEKKKKKKKKKPEKWGLSHKIQEKSGQSYTFC